MTPEYLSSIKKLIKDRKRRVHNLIQEEVKASENMFRKYARNLPAIKKKNNRRCCYKRFKKNKS